MAFVDNKITTADLSDKGVTGLPDAPQLSTEEMQRKFDEIGKEVITPKFNALCDSLDANIPPFADVDELVDGQTYVYDGTEGVMKPVTAKLTFDSLDDVDMTGVVNGMYPRYDYFTRTWKPTASTVSVPSLDDINDVNASSAQDQDLLVRDGVNSVWTAGSIKIDKLKNVKITLPQNKQVMAYNASDDEWTNQDAEGGGHTVEDADGTALTQRDTLQFKGYLKTTDDNVNGKTIVDDTPTEVTWENWKTFTDEQREGIKWKITDVPSADGTIDCKIFKSKWSNSAPTSDFAAQDINLIDGDYDFLLAQFKASKNQGQSFSIIVPKGVNFVLAYDDYNSGVRHFERTVTYVSDTKLTISAATLNGTSRTDIVIPVEFYGFKKTTSVKISAIAHDVKTDADNCMLSDGVTSVESALNYSETEHVVGTWIDGKTVYEKTVSCGAGPNNTSKNIAHNVSNIDKIVYINGIGMSTSTRPIPDVQTSTPSAGMRVYVSSSNITLQSGSDLSGLTCYVTIRYTKTA